MKDSIRKELIKLRKNLSFQEILNNSIEIKNKLFDLYEYKISNIILFYISYNNEVFTHKMIKESIKNNKKVIIPVSYKKKLLLSKLEKWEDLEEGAFNILEPKRNCFKKFNIKDVELILVPGIGFDENGNRIGHGYGYYDNLLIKTKNSTNIGLAFECQIVNVIPVNKHDLPVDKIITEKRIIECKRN
jgi:5-formyltetrahydrofolate cyclo-ligase